MSDFTAIRGVTLTLQNLLKTHITDSTEPQLSGVAIELESPKEMREKELSGISLWLYRVNRNDHALNYPPPRVASDQHAHRPLPLNLHYLIAPITDNHKSAQALLGRVIQVFNDHAILRGSDLQDSLEGGREKLALTLEALSLEDQAQVWNALQQAYQLSICYMVQMVTIDSDREPVQRPPVVTSQTKYAQILEVR